MTAFSWAIAKQRAVFTKVRRDKTKAKHGKNPDFNLAYPDEVREAQAKMFTKLEKRVKEDITKKHKLAMDRRLKSVGRSE